MKVLTLIAFITTLYSLCKAQKLPDVQSESFLAPADIKIDGKLNEWGNLKAYNKANEIYYTLANNNEYLFLSVKATDKLPIEKIVTGGITFSINADGYKTGGANVTFPAYEKGTGQPYIMMWAIRELKDIRRPTAAVLDSLQLSINQKINAGFKFIGISGAPGINDERIPIYNNQGILAASMVDNNLHYNFELAIPLKLLNVKSDLQKLTYNITLNGIAFYGTDIKALNRVLAFVGADGYNYRTDDTSPASWFLVSPTNFKGEYNLAK